MDNHTQAPSCRCWKCWFQDNSTAVSLFFLVLVGIGVLIVLIHEKGVDDKYVVWFEGFASGAFSTWTLSLKTADNTRPPVPPPASGTRDITTQVVTHEEAKDIKDKV